MNPPQLRTLRRVVMWTQWVGTALCLGLAAYAWSLDAWHDAVGAGALALYCSLLALRNLLRGRGKR